MTLPVAMVMAGGTGGHVFPALALARELQKASVKVVWLGTRRGIEARVVPAAGIEIEWLSVSGVRGKGAATLLAAPFFIMLAIWQACKAMRRHRPVVVVGLGGFVAGPGGVAAWLTGRPLVIHEQNAIAGLTNRLLALLATRVLQAFPDSFGANRHTVSTIGNPVRPEFFAQSAAELRALHTADRPLKLLVVGGSQGATSLNRVVPQALAQLCREGRNLTVRHQAGERWLEEARRCYSVAGVTADVTAFIEDVAEAYADADLVICRAGALTISELAAVGVAAILVPFPAAVDDHQSANAAYLCKAGAAVLLSEAKLTPAQLAREIRQLATGNQLNVMAQRARVKAQPHATRLLAEATLTAAGRGAAA